jgi:hypothetical protein
VYGIVLPLPSEHKPQLVEYLQRGRVPLANCGSQMVVPDCGRSIDNHAGCFSREPSTPIISQELESQFGLCGITDAVLNEPAVPHSTRSCDLLHNEQARCWRRLIGAKPVLHLCDSGMAIWRDAPPCRNALVALFPKLAVECSISDLPGAQPQTLRMKVVLTSRHISAIHVGSMPHERFVEAWICAGRSSQNGWSGPGRRAVPRPRGRCARGHAGPTIASSATYVHKG